jgi:ankyrin repeat protein
MRPTISNTSNNSRLFIPTIPNIRNNINPEQAQRELFSAIAFASDEDFPNLCDKAISHGANVNGNNAFRQSAIDCAIRRGSLPILRYLFARGLQTPEINHNGEDIVMLAASLGHTDIVEFLITEGNMQSDAIDAQGITALHIAAIHNYPATIKVLLEHGAHPDTLSTGMRRDELDSIFNQNLNEFNIFTEGKNITPLMIATAHKNYDAANLLISYKANVNYGAIPPLLIAIKNNDERMIKLLCSVGAYSDHPPILNNMTLIEYAIKNNISTLCLQRLLNENSKTINLNSNQIYSILASSIAADRLDYLAILLAAGMDIKNKVDFENLYKLAVNSPKHQEIFNILAYLQANNFEQIINRSNEKISFGEVKIDITHYDLIAKGAFSPVTSKILQILSNIKSKNADNANEQINFALAIELGKEDLLNKQIFTYNFFNLNEENLVPEWITAVEEKANQQCTLLHEVSHKIINKKMTEFNEFMSVIFFKNLIQSKLDPNAIDKALSAKYINKIGLPRELAKSLARIFSLGIYFIISTDSNNYKLDELALLARKIVINLLSYKNFTSESVASEVSSEFLKKLFISPNENQANLDLFFSSPFEFIKKLENRHNLRPPEIVTLQKQLALHLGLPSQFCQYIVKAWSNSISITNQLNQLTTPSAITQAHKHQFSLSLIDELETMSNYPNLIEEKFLEHTCQQLKKWCVNQQPQADINLGKRQSRESDEPNAKRQRQQ